MADRTCSVEGCERSSACRGWCSMHYTRWRRHGDAGYIRQPEPLAAERACTGCGETKPIAEFTKQKLGRGGRRATCRTCSRAISKAWREANPEKWRAIREAYVRNNLAKEKARHLRWTRANPHMVTARNSRRRSQLLGAFVEDVDVAAIYDRDGWLCGICGHPVKRGQESLDHVIPLSRGGMHESTNVQIAHRSCNSAKRDSMPREAT